MKKSMKALMLILAASLVLTACSSKEASEDALNDVTTEESGEAVQTEPTAAAQEATTEEEAASSITYPDTFVDAAEREVVIEKEPVKVVTDYLPLWETLIMLDVMPIAASGAENYIATWDAFNGYDLSSVQDLGAKEVNLELLAELAPDIMLHQAYDVTSLEIENYEKVSNVAVFGSDTKMDWRLSLREVAKIVNKEAKAEEVITEIDKKLKADREKLDEKYSGATVLHMSVMSEDTYYYAYRSDLFDDETGLGLNTPEGYTTSTTYDQISMEAIVAMNPDYIFLNVFDGDEALYEAMQSNTVWQSLKAVKDGHVYRLDGGGHACSPLATVYTVNFITDALLAQ
jgi:iron complex transport system substrate-binding protein